MALKISNVVRKLGAGYLYACCSFPSAHLTALTAPEIGVFGVYERLVVCVCLCMYFHWIWTCTLYIIIFLLYYIHKHVHKHHTLATYYTNIEMNVIFMAFRFAVRKFIIDQRSEENIMQTRNGEQMKSLTKSYLMLEIGMTGLCHYIHIHNNTSYSMTIWTLNIVM